jgi:hypothetical protein
MILGVCLALAAHLSSQTFVPATTFTLAWTHSIEKIRWEEDYAVVPDTEHPTQARLIALKARIKGSGAGMEPPEEAKLVAGWYEYVPQARSAQTLYLTRSEFTGDYEWCVHGQCRGMAELLPSDKGITLLTPCIQQP